MKKITFSLFYFFAFISFSFAQLTLESVDGKKKLEIPVGTEIGLKFPHNTGTGLVCESYLYYQGNLIKREAGNAYLNVNRREAIYSDGDEVAKREVIEYGFIEQKVETTIPLKGLQTVSIHSKSRETMNGLGGTLMLLSALQGFVIGPFLNEDARAVSDIIVGSTFATGFTLTIWPKKKTYHLAIPAKGKAKRLWQLK